MTERVILVDENDNQIGTEEKMKAHELGQLHRAFSIFIYNSEGKMLLQQRAKVKYHSGGLWTNTCCSHPRDGETLNEAVHRRLVEEMGFDCEMKEEYDFIYKAVLDHGLTEHELDHVFSGTFDGEIKPNPEEVESFKWVTLEELQKDVVENSEKYTEWFKIILKSYVAKLAE